VPASDNEIDGVRIVAAVTGLSWRCLDPGGGVQLAVFEMIDANGERIGLLEVTATVPEKTAAFRGAVRSKRWEFDGLLNHWVVWLRLDASINEVFKRIEPALQRLEAAGFRGRFPDTRADDSPPEGAEELGDLGVTSFAVIQEVVPCERAIVFVHPAEEGRSFSMAVVSQAVQGELDKVDNRRKLEDSPTEFGELFIWLEAGAAPAALLMGEIPAFDPQIALVPPPVLGPGMTGVWVATRRDCRERPASALWRSVGGQWRRLEPPPVDVNASY
jgi:hypothetical protein